LVFAGLKVSFPQRLLRALPCGDLDRRIIGGILRAFPQQAVEESGPLSCLARLAEFVEPVTDEVPQSRPMLRIPLPERISLRPSATQIGIDATSLGRADET
jgi:hypothetical protein